MNGCLFFDLDGTIADSGPQIRAALNEVFAGLGVAPLTDVELHATIGPPMQTSIPPLLVARGLDPQTAPTVIKDYRRLYGEKHLPHTPLNEGMAEALETLAGDWTMAVVTSKPEVQAVVAVAAAKVDHHFVTVVGPEADKPVPKSVLLIRAIETVGREQHVDPASCWMIGDRHHDIDAATAVGTKGLGVLWGYGSAEELTEAGAHALADDPRHMVEIITGA